MVLGWFPGGCPIRKGVWTSPSSRGQHHNTSAVKEPAQHLVYYSQFSLTPNDIDANPGKQFKP